MRPVDFEVNNRTCSGCEYFAKSDSRYKMCMYYHNTGKHCEWSETGECLTNTKTRRRTSKHAANEERQCKYVFDRATALARLARGEKAKSIACEYGVPTQAIYDTARRARIKAVKGACR